MCVECLQNFVSNAMKCTKIKLYVLKQICIMIKKYKAKHEMTVDIKTSISLPPQTFFYTN